MSGTGGIRTFFRHLVAESFGDPADVISHIALLFPVLLVPVCRHHFVLHRHGTGQGTVCHSLPCPLNKISGVLPSQVPEAGVWHR